MKLETFEKAQKLRCDIDALISLDNLFRNAAYNKDNTLAALRPATYCDEKSFSKRVMNEEKLSQEMLCMFRDVINTQIMLLRSEFEAL